MNRRGFLRKAIGAVGAIAVGATILPQEVKAVSHKLPPTATLNEGLEGGYIIPELYASDMESLIRRDYAEHIASVIDREVIRGIK